MSRDEFRSRLLAAHARGDAQAQDAVVRAFAHAQLRSMAGALFLRLRRGVARQRSARRLRA
jgi:hypothetical protein